MPSNLENEFNKRKAARTADMQAGVARAKEIADMIRTGAQACATKIREIVNTDSRVAGTFTAQPGGISDQGFDLHFLRANFNVRVTGQVSYNPSNNINQPQQQPSWTAFGIDVSVIASTKTASSPVNKIRAHFEVGGTPVIDAASAIQAAVHDLATR